MTQRERERLSGFCGQSLPDSGLLLRTQPLQPAAPAPEHFSSAPWSLQGQKIRAARTKNGV